MFSNLIQCIAGSTGTSGPHPPRRHRRSHSNQGRLLARVDCREDASLRSKSTGASIDVSWAGSWASSALSDSDDIGWEEVSQGQLLARVTCREVPT